MNFKKQSFALLRSLSFLQQTKKIQLFSMRHSSQNNLSPLHAITTTNCDVMQKIEYPTKIHMQTWENVSKNKESDLPLNFQSFYSQLQSTKLGQNLFSADIVGSTQDLLKTLCLFFFFLSFLIYCDFAQ